MSTFMEDLQGKDSLLRQWLGNGTDSQENSHSTKPARVQVPDGTPRNMASFLIGAVQGQQLN